MTPHGNEPATLPAKGWYGVDKTYYQPGDMLMGSRICTNADDSALFNGKRPHFTLPTTASGSPPVPTGPDYSCIRLAWVFYVQDFSAAMSAEQRCDLVRLSFNPPPADLVPFLIAAGKKDRGELDAHEEMRKRFFLGSAGPGSDGVYGVRRCACGITCGCAGPAGAAKSRVHHSEEDCSRFRRILGDQFVAPSP